MSRVGNDRSRRIGAEADNDPGDLETVVAAYEAAVKRADLEAVHDLIARHGLGFLNHSIPYIVVAARHDQIDATRSARHRREIATDSQALERHALPGHRPDPGHAVGRRDDIRTLAEALAKMSFQDAALLLDRARGRPYADIAESLAAQGEPTTEASLRQRHRRALARLRDMFDSIDSA